MDEQQPLNLHTLRAWGCYNYFFWRFSTSDSGKQDPIPCSVTNLVLCKAVTLKNGCNPLQTSPPAAGCLRCFSVWAQTLPMCSRCCYVMRGLPWWELWPQHRSTELRVIQGCSRGECDWGAVCVGYSCSRLGQDELESYNAALICKWRHSSPGDTSFVPQVPKITTDIHHLLPSSPTKVHPLSLLFAQSFSRDQGPMACPRASFPVSVCPLEAVSYPCWPDTLKGEMSCCLGP